VAGAAVVGAGRRATGRGGARLAARTLICGNCVPVPLICGEVVGGGVDGVSTGGAGEDEDGGVDCCGACVCAGGFVAG